MKNKSLRSLLLLVVVMAMCLGTFLAGCGQKSVEPTTDPADSQATTETPTTEATEPQEEEPTEAENVISVGPLQMHEKGKNGDLGIYFTLPENDLPFDDWNIEYKPASYNTIMLYRDGETYQLGNIMTGMVVKYSETSYYLKLEQWNIGNYFPMRNGDVLKIDGKFKNSVHEVSFEVDTTYILISEGLVFFSTEYPDENAGVSVIRAGMLSSHSSGKTNDGVYCTMEKNRAPYDEDWTIEYSPVDETVIKLIRNGKTYNVANPAAGTLVKYSDTNYFLKMQQWMIKDYYPIRDGDILVVNGKFVNSKTSTVMRISKTYISIIDGLVFFSDEYPSGNSVEAVQIPIMQTHPNGLRGNGFYFKADANSLPYDDWSVEYYPKDASVIKLFRDGKTYNIANPAAGTIVKYNDTDHFFKLEQWIYKKYYPFKDGDVILVEGKFVNSGHAAVMEIGATYIAISNGMAYFFSEYPTGQIGPDVVQGSAMSYHANGWRNETNGGVYFHMELNDAPYDSGWNVRYTPTAANCVKLVRDGVTYDVANTSAEMLAKYSEDSYYMEFWPILMKPIVEGDMLIVEGNFVNAANNVLLHIEKTYITFENGKPVFSTDGPDVLEAGFMQAHPNGWNSSSNNGLYFTMTNNEIPYDDWNIEYEPTAADAIQLVRNGEVHNIGQIGKGAIVKYGDTDYFLKLETWTIGDYAPIVPGDVLIVEGKFVNTTNGVKFAVNRTVITVGEDYSLTFAEEEPSDHVIQAGMMQSHTNGWNTENNKGLYFSMAENNVPYDADGQRYYTPTAESDVKLIRNGEVVEIAQTDREFIVKYGPAEYYLKLDSWTIGDYFPLVPGDVLVVEGVFSDNFHGAHFQIDKTYILIGEEYALTFTDTYETGETEVTDHGPMFANSNNGWTATGGLYFTMAANDVPYDDWSVRFKPTSESVVKLVRDGVTYNVAHTQRETIIKYSDTNYYYEFWTLDTYKPVLAGDVLIVEGSFYNAATDATLTIAKTVITFNVDGTATFVSEGSEPETSEPEATEPTNHGAMFANSNNGWTATGGLYFTMPANDVAYNEDWSVRYKPVSESVVKLVRDGVTYNVAHTQRETIIKYSDTNYYYEFWTLDTYKPVLAGDVLIVEGSFYNAANDATLTIAKTVITFNADGTATFVSEGSEPEASEPEATEPTSHGAMFANSAQGWTPTEGLYFTMAANDLPFDDWNVSYRPTSESAVKLVRNGVTYNVAHTLRDTIVKYSDTNYYFAFWTLDTYKPVLVGDVLIVEGTFYNAANDATLNIAKTTITFNADGTATFVSEGSEPEASEPETSEPEETISYEMKVWEEKGWNTNSNGGFWFTMDPNEIPADESWATEYTPVSEEVIKLVRDGQTVNIAVPGRGTLIKASDAEYYLKLEWNIGDYANQITVGDTLILEGDFTNSTNGVTFTLVKTTVTIGADYALTIQTEEEPEEEPDALQVGAMMAHSGGITDSIIYFTLAENDLPANLTKSDFRPVEAGAIKLIRDGQTYDVGDPNAKTIVKQTAAGKYRLLRNSLTMEVQAGDILMVEGIFTGGNTDSETVYTIYIAKSYILIGDGTVSFSTELPAEE